MDDAYPDLRMIQRPRRKKAAGKAQPQGAAPEPAALDRVVAPPSDSEVCHRRAEDARALAAKTSDAAARDALEVVATNWDDLGRHLAGRPDATITAPESSRKSEARRAALGIVL